MPVFQDEDNAVAKAFADRPRSIPAKKNIPFYSSLALAEVSEGPMESIGLGLFRSRTGSTWRMDEGRIWRDDGDMSWVDDIVTSGDTNRPTPPRKLMERYRQFKQDPKTATMSTPKVLAYLSDTDPVGATPRAAEASSEAPSPIGANGVAKRRGVTPGGQKTAVTEKGDQVPVRQPLQDGDRVFSISRQIPGKVTKVVNNFVVEVKFDGPEGSFTEETLASDLQPDRTHFASHQNRKASSEGTWKTTEASKPRTGTGEADRNRVPLGSNRPKVGVGR